MPTHVANEVNANSTGAFVLSIPVQAECAEMPFKLAAQKWRRLAATCISRPVGAEQDHCSVGTRSSSKVGRQGWRDL